MEQFLSVRLVSLLFFTKAFEVVLKSQSFVYRNSQHYIFFCWRNFGDIFENQIFVVRIKTDIYYLTDIGKYVSTESVKTFTGIQESSCSKILWLSLLLCMSLLSSKISRRFYKFVLFF